VNAGSVGAAAAPEVAAALKECRRSAWGVVLFSAAVNGLMLAGPLYMLQVYDRVLSARSVPTLVALSALLVGAYGFQAVLDIIRSRIVVRAAALLDQQLGTTVHAAVVRLAILSRAAGEANQPVRDLDQIRAFLTGPGPVALVDLPWAPVFLAICWFIHPWLGLLALAGIVVLLAMTLLTERKCREPAREFAREATTRAALIEATRRNSESAVALGMTGALAERWSAINEGFLARVIRSSDLVGTNTSITRILRLVLQSAMLGLGAYLVIRQELTAGAMIAASIMMGRALAPVETVIANWRSFVAARQSVTRLSQQLARLGARGVVTRLPAPFQRLDIEQVAVAVPGRTLPILTNIQFRLDAGEAVGIIGESGVGKTSLLRTLLGIWPPLRGQVRLDGASIDQWDPDLLGRHVGFVSQNIELFDGTVAENIARMAKNPDAGTVIEAARVAGVHELILRMPGGYDAPIGEAGGALSAGQRQRIALARAVFGRPFLIALDEPASNLDNEGEMALQQALIALKARGALVLLIAHRPSALAACDKVLFLANGTQRAFGARDEVLHRVLARPVAPAAAGLKVVGEAASGADS
jgi:PrtD family type I secretion system ABC transporter